MQEKLGRFLEKLRNLQILKLLFLGNVLKRTAEPRLNVDSWHLTFRGKEINLA
jgi:hypothetical protein